MTKVLQFHGGNILGLDTSPLDHFAATTGDDGTVRCWDYVDKKLLFSSAFEREDAEGVRSTCAGTCVLWAPKTVDQNARTVLVGFANGVMRVLLRGATGWKMSQVMKPHGGAISAMAYSHSGRVLCTGSADGTIWFFEVEQGPHRGLRQIYEPLGFVSLKQPVKSLAFRSDNGAVLVAIGEGGVRLVPVPPARNIKNIETFEVSNLEVREYQYQRAVKIDANDPFAAARRNRPKAISATFLMGSDTRFLVTMGGEEAGAIHEVQWMDNGQALWRSSMGMPDPAAELNVMKYSRSQDWLMAASNHGAVQMRLGENNKKFLYSKCHDGSAPRPARASVPGASLPPSLPSRVASPPTHTPARSLFSSTPPLLHPSPLLRAPFRSTCRAGHRARVRRVCACVCVCVCVRVCATGTLRRARSAGGGLDLPPPCHGPRDRVANDIPPHDPVPAHDPSPT